MAYNFKPSDADEAVLQFAVATLMPRVQGGCTVGAAPGRLLVVTFPDKNTMQDAVVRVAAADTAGEGVEDSVDDELWRRYFITCHFTLSVFGAPEHEGCSMFDNNIMFSVGYFEDAPSFVFRGMLTTVTCDAWFKGYFAAKKKTGPTTALPHQKATYGADLLDMLRGMVCFGFPDTLMTGHELVEHMRSACAACGGQEVGGTTRCPGCGMVAICSNRACLRGGRVCGVRYHHAQRCDAVHMVRGILEMNRDPSCAINWKRAIDLPVQIPTVPGVRLQFTMTGMFDDLLRSRLVWDVTRPPREARLVPGCMSIFEVWRRGYVGAPISDEHLEARLWDDHVDAVVLPHYFGHVPVQNVRGAATLGDVMGAVYDTMRAAPPRWLAAAPLASLAEMDVDHRRLDHVQPTRIAGRWRLQLGGRHIFHEGIQSTDCRLSTVTFVNRRVW